MKLKENQTTEGWVYQKINNKKIKKIQRKTKTTKSTEFITITRPTKTSRETVSNTVHYINNYVHITVGERTSLARLAVPGKPNANCGSQLTLVEWSASVSGVTITDLDTWRAAMTDTLKLSRRHVTCLNYRCK